MSRIIIFFVVGLAFCAELYAQDNPNIVSMIYFKPKAGQKEQYLAGLKEHTEKHHNKGVARVRTYRIISGSKSGWYVRVLGPFTWADVDKLQAVTSSKAHVADAAKNIIPWATTNSSFRPSIDA